MVMTNYLAMENMNHLVVYELRRLHDVLIQILNCLLLADSRVEGVLEHLAEQQWQQKDSQPVLEKWITKEEAMEYLAITKSTYYRWVKEGILTPRGVAGQDKFLVADLTDLIEKRRHRYRKRPSSSDD